MSSHEKPTVNGQETVLSARECARQVAPTIEGWLHKHRRPMYDRWCLSVKRWLDGNKDVNFADVVYDAGVISIDEGISITKSYPVYAAVHAVLRAVEAADDDTFADVLCDESISDARAAAESSGQLIDWPAVYAATAAASGKE